MLYMYLRIKFFGMGKNINFQATFIYFFILKLKFYLKNRNKIPTFFAIFTAMFFKKEKNKNSLRQEPQAIYQLGRLEIFYFSFLFLKREIKIERDLERRNKSEIVFFNHLEYWVRTYNLI